MASRPSARLVAALSVIAVVLVVASIVTVQTRRGAWTFLWQHAGLVSFQHDSGHAYSSPTGVPDLSSHERPSPAALYEDGRALEWPNVSRESIQQLGAGRYAFWHDQVYFAASDNSDPAHNGRHYEFAYPPVTRAAARTLYAVTALVLLIAVVAWARLVFAVGARAMVVATVDAAQRIVVMAPPMRIDASIMRRWRVSVVALWVVTVVLAVAAQTAFLTRTGSWTALWTEVELGALQPESGFAFVAHTGRPDVGSQVAPEPTALYEDGRQLGLRNALHSEIREVGRGRYSFWYDYVIFATSDNSDPRTNGRRYTMMFSPISRRDARLLYLATVVLLLVSIATTWNGVRSGRLRVPPQLLGFARRHAGAFLMFATVATLVLPAILRVSPEWSPAVSDQWYTIVAIQAVLAVIVRWKWGRRIPAPMTAAVLVGLAAGYYILTVWAPHRTQGCHTDEPYSVWAMYCVAPDSSSYYIGYRVGSTRQPLYPWFIEAMTVGTGFDGRQFVQNVKPGEPRLDPADPLFRVVHGQQIVMLAASMLACYALMRLLGSIFPAVIFLLLYDMQFYSAGELNFVLTEPLVQTFQFLLVAAFAWYLATRRSIAVIAAGAACGLAYLTRQASAYSALLLLLISVMALLADRRSWRNVAVAFAVFAAICSVPDLYAFITTGNLGKQQESLQYQYRIAHAMQYAQPGDLPLMPDEESRQWLQQAIVRRDAEHRMVEEKFRGDEYNILVYYVNQNLYAVATPPNLPTMSPQFYMKVATPILVHHWTEYARFAFRFWVVAMQRPGVARLGVLGYSPWVSYAALFGLAVVVGGWIGIAGATMVLCHWAAVAMACLFAAPIPRMVWASEFLVVLAGVVLAWSAGEKAVLAATRWLARRPADAA